MHVAVVSWEMGVFSDVGRKFEKTKQTLTDSKRAKFACTSCERPVTENYEHCPRCGEESVEPVA